MTKEKIPSFFNKKFLKTIKGTAGVVVLALSVLLNSGCSNTLDGIVENYNSNYTPKGEKEDTTNVVGAEDFTPSEMLIEVYRVYRYGQICLSGPENASEYCWIIKVPAVMTGSKVEEEIGTEQNLTYKLPGVCLLDVENKITLIVKDEEGNEYTDTASILLY